MSAVRKERLSIGKVAALGGAAIAVLAAAVTGDVVGYSASSQILLVVVASFGGAVFGSFIISQRKRHAPRQNALVVMRGPTAAELHEMVGIGCWEWDVKTDVFTWNTGMYGIYGRDVATFRPTRRSMLDVVAPQDVQSVLDTRWRDQDGPPNGTLECRIVRPDGEHRHVRYAWQTVDGDGDHPKVFGIAQDVTAVRVADTVMRQDDTQLRGMVECTADYVWEYSVDRGAALPEGIRLQSFGGTGVTSARRPCIDVRADHDFGPLMRLIEERTKFRDVAVPILDGKGERRWVNLSGHPQFDRERAFYGYQVVAADVTESIRERDIEEERRQAGAVGRLASGLAHEINNLLQPILIYSAFGAGETKQNDKLQLYFTRITRAAERASFIVKNVLSFARQTAPGRENLNVFSVVRETLDLMSGTLDDGRTIELIAADDGLIVQTERTGVAQIVTNLIANAADVTASGGTIIVRLEQVLVASDLSKVAGVAPGRYCRISVQDNGPGIPSDLVAKVFDPFFTTKPQGKGTGLGLAVVSGMAKSWGGGAGVDSAPGSGSIFSVYLPLAERELQAAQ